MNPTEGDLNMCISAVASLHCVDLKQTDTTETFLPFAFAGRVI